MASKVALIVSVICFAVLFEQVAAECCKNSGKFGCCGFSKCNFFCCSCRSTPRGVCKDERDCDFDPSVMGTVGGILGKIVGRRRRDTISGQSDIDAYNKFTSIDSNGDGLINLAETAAFFNATMDALAKNGGHHWFLCNGHQRRWVHSNG